MDNIKRDHCKYARHVSFWPSHFNRADAPGLYYSRRSEASIGTGALYAWMEASLDESAREIEEDSKSMDFVATLYSTIKASVLVFRLF